jgi:hypothetical protein
MTITCLAAFCILAISPIMALFLWQQNAHNAAMKELEEFDEERW